MKSIRQRQEEALGRLEERVKLWEETAANGQGPKLPTMPFFSNKDTSIRMKATNIELLRLLTKELALRKIHNITRDIDNLKKKLSHIKYV